MAADRQGSIPHLLVIDDWPAVSERVRWAVPDWNVQAVPNGALGIAYLRQHWSEVDLVLLDVFMPHDGVLTLAQIGAEARTRGRPRFPVVPFTISSDVVDLQALAALGAALPLQKDLPPAELQAALRELVGQPAQAPTDDPLLPYLLRAATASEHTVRADSQEQLPVALLARGVLGGGVLREMLAAAGARVVVSAEGGAALRPFLMRSRVALIVADAMLNTESTLLSDEFDVPELLVALQPSVAFRLAGAGRSVLLDVPAPAELNAILRRVASGETYTDQRLEGLLAKAPVSEVERDVLRLVLAGKRTDEIAGVLFMPDQSVRRHRSHLLAKLGLERADQLRDWIDGMAAGG